MKTLLLLVLSVIFSAIHPLQEADYEFIACDQETKHVNERNEVSLIMINDLEEEVIIYWMNARKQKTEYARLFKGEEFPINSATNHYWVLETGSTCLGVIQPKTSGDIHFSEFPQLDRGEDDGD
ncbi:MAG: hypothetical protein R8G66_00835 [Cytophagales bacterium]|nr:hypothetical protein [Cytophagales bacterium]